MSTTIAIIGIDLGKSCFHLTALDTRDAIAWRRKLTRAGLARFIANSPPCPVAMESCPGSQYWARRFAEAGFEPRILPAQFVKPFLKAGKNDFNDSLAIAEAARRPGVHPVPLKSTEQLELQAIHRVRVRLIAERTRIINQMRALLLEHGIVCAVGRARLERALPQLLEDAENGLSPRLRALLDHLRRHWRALDPEIEALTALLGAEAKASEACTRLCAIPGVGPVVATAMVAAVGNARAFRRGRDLSAWLGLVPRQHSTGDKTRLGAITKRGNVYLRSLVVQGARSLTIHMSRSETPLGRWLGQLERRVHRHVAIIALANKLTRLCWKLLSSGEHYRSSPALGA